MKKYIIPVVLVVALGFYLLFVGKNSSTTVTPQPTEGTPAPEGGTPAPTTTPPPRGTGPGTGGTTSGAYRDGTYTGPVTDAFYGNIQVVATVKGGKITGIETPVYPKAPGETTLVSNRSLPILKQEAIAAQSAKIDVVSGATQTSEGFQQSLAAALAEARN